MPSPLHSAVQRLTAHGRQRLPWLVLLLGIALMGMVFTAPASPRLAVHADVDLIQAAPGKDQPGQSQHGLTVSESNPEAGRGTRQRPAASSFSSAVTAKASPSLTFVAAATDTRLRYALESAHRYPMAPYLRLHPGHAPPPA